MCAAITPDVRRELKSYAYWNGKRTVWPELSRLALFWTTFPTSSIAAERTFGVLRHVQSPLRGSQLPATVRREVMFRVNVCVQTFCPPPLTGCLLFTCPPSSPYSEIVEEMLRASIKKGTTLQVSVLTPVLSKYTTPDGIGHSKLPIIMFKESIIGQVIYRINR